MIVFVMNPRYITVYIQEENMHSLSIKKQEVQHIITKTSVNVLQKQFF